ncbi:MAG TPA: hypothetical protein VMZ50_09735 [Phycisphaerae bacterium]|nr:hypothetical protein [Phycisphaerae bacterium]
MRLAVLRRTILGAIALVAAVMVAACTNPFEPISKSDKIEGLSYVDYSLTWDRWDSDPEYDGVVITPDYSNEFGDALSFHDKPHRVVIEFYEQIIDEDDAAAPIQVGGLVFSRSVEYENSDDDIRVPIEAYRSALEAADYDLAEEAQLFVVMRVFPPQAFPRPELPVGYPDQTVFKPEVTEENLTPNP